MVTEALVGDAKTSIMIDLYVIVKMRAGDDQDNINFQQKIRLHFCRITTVLVLYDHRTSIISFMLQGLYLTLTMQPTGNWAISTRLKVSLVSEIKTRPDSG